MRNPVDIQGVTFNDGDLAWGMFAQTDFVNCTFHGTARNCNFAEASFTNCTFAPNFTFVACNLCDSTGLPERLAPPPRVEPTIPPGSQPRRP